MTPPTPCIALRRCSTPSTAVESTRHRFLTTRSLPGGARSVFHLLRDHPRHRTQERAGAFIHPAQLRTDRTAIRSSPSNRSCVQQFLRTLGRRNTNMRRLKPVWAKILKQPGLFAMQVLKAFQKNQGLLLSGALAYYILISIIPLLTLLLLVLSYVVDENALMTTLPRYIGLVLPGDSEAII